VGSTSEQASPRGPQRLRERADFSRVMRTGRRSRHALLHCVAGRNGTEVSRIGFSVGKQVGGAVIRNRVKRRLRMMVRELDWVTGFDIVVVAHPESCSATYGELQDALYENAIRLKLLHPEDR